MAAEDFGRPIMAGPGTPADQVKILRAAFNAAIKDPELLAEAEKGKMDVDPVGGEDLQQLAQRVMDQPAEVRERVKKLFAN